MMRLVAIVTGLIATVPAHAQSAADAYYDPAEMAAARASLKSGHGDQVNSLILGERLEFQSNDGDSLTVWEGQGWIGGDLRKLWIKTEGEFENDDGRFEEVEVQALFSRAISPFWDFQAGIRQDFEPDPSRTYAVVGAQGLAPYWFELDGSLFLSDEGDLSARVEAEYEIRFTQRLILQPRVEINAALSDDEAIGVGSGISTAEAALRLRYEVRREFAPYIGVGWNRAFGDTKRFRRAADEQVSDVSVIAGIRFWF